MRCKEVIIAINSCSTKMPHIITVRSKCQVYFLASIMFQSQHNSCSMFLLDWRAFISRFLVYIQGQNILLHLNNIGHLLLSCILVLDLYFFWIFKYGIRFHFKGSLAVCGNKLHSFIVHTNVSGCNAPLFIFKHRPLYLVCKVFEDKIEWE